MMMDSPRGAALMHGGHVGHPPGTQAVSMRRAVDLVGRAPGRMVSVRVALSHRDGDWMPDENADYSIL
jgi:hypothetical protein